MFNKKNRLKKEEERTKANALIVQRAKEAADLNAQITTLLAQVRTILLKIFNAY